MSGRSRGTCMWPQTRSSDAKRHNQFILKRKATRSLPNPGPEILGGSKWWTWGPDWLWSHLFTFIEPILPSSGNRVNSGQALALAIHLRCPSFLGWVSFGGRALCLCVCFQYHRLERMDQVAQNVAQELLHSCCWISIQTLFCSLYGPLKPGVSTFPHRRSHRASSCRPSLHKTSGFVFFNA